MSASADDQRRRNPLDAIQSWHVIALALVAVLVAVAFAAFASGGSEANVTVSNEGRAVTLGDVAAADLERTVGGTPTHLGILGSQRFYRLDGTSKGTCYGISQGNGKNERFSFITCPSAEEGFPTRKRPVVDASVAEKRRDGTSFLYSVQGWAADDVKRVVAIDRLGREVASAPVDRNLYAIEPQTLANKEAITLVALDADGEPLYTKRFEHIIGSQEGH